jgi:hypothetical protein
LHGSSYAGLESAAQRLSPTTGCSGRRWRAAAEPGRWAEPTLSCLKA